MPASHSGIAPAWRAGLFGLAGSIPAAGVNNYFIQIYKLINL